MVLKCFALCKTFQENWPILLGDGMMENMNPSDIVLGDGMAGGGGGHLCVHVLGIRMGGMSWWVT